MSRIHLWSYVWPAVRIACAALCPTMVVGCGSQYPVSRSCVQNVIVMVPDGASQSIQTLARWYKGAPLHLDGLNSGTASTWMANSVITGSAAAATAFATGHKTSARFLGIGPRTDDLLTGFRPTAAAYEPVATVLEAAKLQGKAVGLVATSDITHATPAAFASHIQDRDLQNDIMEQMVYQDLDVVFGGGAGFLIPEGRVYITTFGQTWKGKRFDGEDLLASLKERGYQFVDNAGDMAALQCGPAWGLFGDSHLDPQMDRGPDAPQPALADMTAKAIEILARDPDGFFLLVEGSQVDWAAHGNDPAYMVTEFLAFDEAVGRALDFARDNGHTNVYIWPDHNTGGLTIGNRGTSFKPGSPDPRHRHPIYTAVTIEDLAAPLKRMRLSAAALAKKIGDEDDQVQVKAALRDYWGIDADDRDLEEIDILRKQESDTGRILGLARALAEVISRNHLMVGWTTYGHSGEDVPVWSYGPHRLVGTFDNTELARRTALALGVDLDQATCRLFVDLADVRPDFLLSGSDAANPTAIIGKHMALPVNKDILIIGESVHRLGGIVIHAPQAGNGHGRVFIPKDAAEMINGMQ